MFKWFFEEVVEVRMQVHEFVDDEQVPPAPGVTLPAIATPGQTPDHHACTLGADGAPALLTGGSSIGGTVAAAHVSGAGATGQAFEAGR